MFEPVILSFDYSGDPVDVFRVFAGDPYAFFLDSNLYHGEHGRYSFIGCDPFDVLVSDSPEAFEFLRRKYSRCKYGEASSYTPLVAGAVGFVGYPVGLAQEGITTDKPKDIPVSDCCFGLYDTVITVDHFTNKLYVCSDGSSQRDPVLRPATARQRAESFRQRLMPVLRSSPANDVAGEALLPPADITLQSNFTKDEYLRTVRRALRYIRDGDIYQVNLSQCFSLFPQQEYDPLTVYRWLRKFSPSSFAGYFNGGTYQILSSSPERFLKKQGRTVETRPMKGTRPRGETLSEDLKQKELLLRSAKDKAELLMITDLERNDLGKVCQFGSVKVKDIRTIEEYRTVYQATSTIQGVLAEECDEVELLKNCFPGGSITGCPKIRSMQIIEELEPSSRGVYTGALGYMSFSGEMDFNILIRTMVCSAGRITFHAGGGIVADSDPENEYRETLIKAKAMHESLAYVFSGQHSPESHAQER